MEDVLKKSYPDRTEPAYTMEDCGIGTSTQMKKEISIEEIRFQISIMKNGKSSGPSIVRAEILKTMPDNMVVLLHTLFETIYRTARIPECWKKIRLALVPKGNGEHRPIGITNQVRKLFEKVYLNSIEHKLVFAYQQGGFVRNLGTQNHALILDNKLRRSNGKAIMITLDMKKAYDTVDRKIMYRKMINEFNLCNEDMALIYEMMEHNIVEIVQNKTIKSKHLNLGLPQGCTLSPSFFNAFINDICEIMPDRLRNNILLYADDIMIISDYKDDLDEMLNILEVHSMNNNYKFNPDKCYMMTNQDVVCNMYGKPISKVMNIKYLGYIFNLKGLDIDDNLKIIRSKVFGRAAMIKRFVTSTNILNPRHTNTMATIIHAYKVYCRPLLDYPLALMSSFKSLREGCEVIQRGIVKYLIGLNHRIPTRVLYGIVPIEKVAFRGIRLSNKLRIRSESMSENYLYKRIFDSNNTRIFRFIKSTSEVDDMMKNKQVVKEHYIENEVISGFNLIHIGNKFRSDKFVKLLNLRIRELRDDGEIEKRIIEYIIENKEIT